MSVMALRRRRRFSLLLVIVAFLLFFFSFGHLSNSISWTAFLGNNRHKCECVFDRDKICNKEKNSAPLSEQKAVTESTKRNPVAKLTTHQMKISTKKPPMTKVPVAKAPVAKAHVAKTLMTKAPMAKPPVAKASTTKAPMTKTPTAKASMTKAPMTKPPMAKAPMAKAPVAKASMTKTPMTKALMTKAPMAKASMTKAPMTKPPMAKAPVAKASMTKTPMAKAPMAKALMTKTPMTKAPMAKTRMTKAIMAKTPMTKAPMAKTLMTKATMAKTLMTKAPMAKTLMTKAIMAKTPMTKAPMAKTLMTKAPMAKTLMTKAPMAKAPMAETPMPILSKKSFQKLPLWDFEDVYNQDAPPSLTRCVQSLRNSDYESFKKAFLPNIRLFLHKDNVNMSEWNRLSHFNNPFGFMEYKYDDVMASVKLIPEPKEPLILPKQDGDGCVRCAVVGNGGILNGSKMGQEIDAHDYVFRMNGAVIKGHEEDVGNRTSVYVHTAHSITTSAIVFKKYGYTCVPTDEGIKYVMIPEGMRDFNWLEGLLKGEKVSSGPYRNKWPKTYYGGQYNESRFYVLHQDFLRYVRNRFLKSPILNSTHWPTVRPTNGAFTVFLALQTCDVVNVYGFMTENFSNFSNYYFENIKTKVIFYINHDLRMEKELWAKLHNSKILRLYQRTDSETSTEKPKKG